MADLKTNIVLVDDDQGTLQMYALLLSKQDYYVHKFLSAIDALSFLRFTDKPIELIIADLNMPLMDGLKFIKQVRNVPTCISTPFVFLTALDDSNFRLKAYKEGAIDYIQKPIQNELFIAKVNAIVRSYLLHALSQNILLKGTKRTFTVEEIISYCEQEQIEGYVSIVSKEGEGILMFDKGHLGDISAGNLKDSDAFEKMISWEEFRFLIARGKYNPSATIFLRK